MTWIDLRADVEEMFSLLTVCIDTRESWATERTPAPTTPEAAARREAKRKARMEADPAYAAKRAEQQRKAAHRRRKPKAKPRGTWSYYEFRGRSYTAAELAALPEARASAERIRERIRKQGWDVERAVTTPAGSQSTADQVRAS